MKLGFLTAALPMLSLEETAKWAQETGFGMIEIACWPSGGATRRYAGVTHIEVATLTEKRAAEIRQLMADHELEISSLGYYPNPLHPDIEHRTTVIDHLKRVIEGAAMIGVPIVGTFAGRDQNKTLEANFDEFANVWPGIVGFAKQRGVKIAIENCPMIFSNDEWPGGQNLAISPSVWRRMFEIIPDENFGLNLDPSHLIWQFIDDERVTRRICVSTEISCTSEV
jgi:sugar phosphate isomerase/epimerase